MPKVKNFRQPPDLPKLEEEILQFWQEGNTFENSIEQRSSNDSFVFFDGPPFATGLPHYGHILASTIKDVVPRYQTMKGKHVERIWGWDCHGLPIENIVEKELSINSKKDIEQLGVAKFNRSCCSTVLRYADEWCKIIPRLGRWVNMESCYKTMDAKYTESVWWVFKQLWDQDLVYSGFKPMHLCPRCGTPLSNFEVTQGYKDIKDCSVVVKFKLEGGQNLKLDSSVNNSAQVTQMVSETQPIKKTVHLSTDNANIFLLAWTTTPWTLPGNCLLAVNPEETYAVLRDSDVGADESNNFYLVAKTLVEQVISKTNLNLQIVGEIFAQQLINLSYQPPFPYYSNTKQAFKLVSADFVTLDEGTGIVHVAPGFGEDDFYLGEQHEVPLVQHVDQEGRFVNQVTEFAGLKVKPKGDSSQTDRKIVAWLEDHNLLFSLEKIKHSYPHCWRCDTPLLNYAANSWFVAVTKIREQLLKNNQKINWSPSHMKNGRFGKWLEGVVDWAVSRDRYWGAPLPIWQSDDGDSICIGSVSELEKLSGEKIEDLHKDVVDKITFKKDGQTYRRVSQVFDCWFESGAMPYAQHHYPFEDKEQFSRRFPADFIAEGADQTRGWFYTLHVLATALTRKEAGNVLPVEDCSSAFKNVMVTGIILANDGKKMSKRLKNYPDPVDLINRYGSDSLRLYLTQSPVVKSESLRFDEKKVEQLRRQVLVIFWNMIAFYQLFADKSTDITQAPKDLDHALDQWLYNKVVKLSQDVTSYMDQYDLQGAVRLLIASVNELSTWYLRLSRDRLRADGNVQVSQLFGWALYVLAQLFAPFTPFFSEIVFHNLIDGTGSIHLTNWPDFSAEKLDQTLLREMDQVAQLVELGRRFRAERGIKLRHPLAKVILSLNSPLQYQKELESLIKNELNVKQVEWIETQTQDDCELSVDYDLEVTPKLEKEAQARDLIREIQVLRKKAGLPIDQEVNAFVPSWPNAWRDEIEARTNTRLKKGGELSLDL